MVNKETKESYMIAVIHARGGSRRIPMKNIALLNGKPLISYMIQAAINSKKMDRVIVSTDHPEIKRVSLECGAEVPFMRPPKLSEDCPSEWVTKHAVEFVENETGKKVDVAVTLQPTTPFCVGEDIDKCVRLLMESDSLGSVFSAKIAHERPEWMFAVKEGSRAELFLGGELKGDRGVFQSLPRLVLPNGGIYASRRKVLFEEGVLVSKNTGVYIMPDERSVDIDEPIDLAFAEFMMNRKKEEVR